MAKIKAKSNIKKSNNDVVWYGLALTRISIGFIFLWAFFDKLFGLGFATCRNPKTDAVTYMCEKAWISGGSPTDGFLKFATKGPLADFYSSLAGNQFIAILFMMGLLLIGLALVFGVGVKIAAISGSLMLLMMWSAVLPPENNPFIDDHIIYILILMVIKLGNNNQKLGLGGWWASQPVVKQNPILR